MAVDSEQRAGAVDPETAPVTVERRRLSRTPPRIEPWPVALAACLAGMIGVCLLFWLVAVRNPDPPVVDDAWTAGLAEARLQEARARAAARGLRLDLAASPAPGSVRVAVTLRDADGALLDAEDVTVRRVRPAEGGLDADFRLERDGAVFRGQVPLPRVGRWRLVARATHDGDRLEQQTAWWQAP